MEFRQTVGTKRNYRVNISDEVGDDVPTSKPTWTINIHSNPDGSHSAHQLAVLTTSADGMASTILAEAPGIITVTVMATYPRRLDGVGIVTSVALDEFTVKIEPIAAQVCDAKMKFEQMHHSPL